MPETKGITIPRKGLKLSQNTAKRSVKYNFKSKKNKHINPEMKHLPVDDEHPKTAISGFAGPWESKLNLSIPFKLIVVILVHITVELKGVLSSETKISSSSLSSDCAGSTNICCLMCKQAHQEN